MATPSPFDMMVTSLVQGVVDDAKARLVDGVRQTLDGVTKSTTRRLGSAAADAATHALHATGSIILIDERVTLDQHSEVAVVLGRRASQATPITANASVPAGRYRAVVVLIPEE